MREEGEHEKPNHSSCIHPADGAVYSAGTDLVCSALLACLSKAFQKEYETFQQDVLNFQKKVEAGAFLSRERAESEQSRLQKKEQQLAAKQQDLENLRQQLSADFMNQQAALTQQLQDSVQAYLRELNADGHYHLILNDAVLMNKVAGYDITDEVVEGLNARYKK